MPGTVFDEVLDCGQLPSLPSIAVRVLELTGKEDAAITEIAGVVRQDQALSAKVLRTVNSSYYGLAKPCGSIDRALMYLGLATVKSLVLGFSLVETTSSIDGDGGFDLDAHWRRSIHGASAAREIAMRSGKCDPDEAFTAGLFQDVGMLAMSVALGERYTRVLDVAREAPLELCRFEHEAFETDHAIVGAALAEKWKLPSEICGAIREHHTGETKKSGGLTKVVSLGRLAAEALAPGATSMRADAFCVAHRKECGGTTDQRELLETIDAASRTLAKMFDVEMGETANVRRLMSKASERSLELQMQTQREAEELAHQARTDGLTGLANRKSFDDDLAREHRASGASAPLGVAFFDADKFKSVNDTHGHAAGDAVLVEIAQRAADAVGGDGTVYRYGGEEFVALLPGLGVEGAERVAERIRGAMADDVFDLRAVEDAPDELAVTVSVGVSSTDATGSARDVSADKLVQEADQAVYAAKKAGRNRVRVYGDLRMSDDINKAEKKAPPAPAPSRGAGGAELPTILLIEDDALAATLMKTILTRRGAVRVDWTSSGDEAAAKLDAIAGGRAPAPALVVADLNVPGQSGVEILGRIRAAEALRDIPVVMITASTDEGVERDCRHNGATAFVRKDDLCTDLPKWIARLVATATGGSAAAA